jgi:hypothetical protein
MIIETALPREVYVRTPLEAPTYIRTLETGVVALETTLQTLGGCHPAFAGDCPKTVGAGAAGFAYLLAAAVE